MPDQGEHGENLQHAHVAEGLRDREEIFRDLFENSPDAIFVEDTDGNVLDVNPAACRLHGMDRRTLLGKNVLELVPPDRREEVARDYPKVVKGELDYVEGHSWTQDGHSVPVELRVSHFSYAGAPALLLHVRDITERKRVEGQLRQREAELAHMARVHDLGQMAAILAHEINQPLYAITNYVNGMIRRLKNGMGDRDQFDKVLNETLSEAQRAAGIIAHLRRLLGKREPRLSTADLNEIIHDLLRLTEAEARCRGVAVHLELAHDLPHVIVDQIQFQQVVLNLLRNGFDAMSGLGNRRRSLTITTSLLDGDSIEIAVRDTGHGLSPDVADKVFEPFFTTKPEGLGMGLAISRSIVESHGGQIRAVPNPTQGTTFRFTVPFLQTQSD